MTLSELITYLQEIEDQHGDIEVRLAHQPNWPFEYRISDSGVVAVDINQEHGDSDDDADFDPPRKPERMVCFIAEGGQLGYLPTAAVHELGWGRR